MKKSKIFCGFTLIELLVTISILAILGTISITVFFTAQQTTRDGKRLAEISSLARSIEVAKDYQTKKYFYNAQNFAKDYPNGAPEDPLNPSNGRKYCVSVNTSSTTPPASCNINWVSDCPSSCNGASYVTVNQALNDFVTGNVLSWNICASMERATLPHCEKSLTK